MRISDWSSDVCSSDLDPDAVAQAHADQGVVHQHQRLVHRQADVVDELRGRRAGAAFGAVDDDEVRQGAGFLHRLGHREPFPRVADRQLEAGRLAAESEEHTSELQSLMRISYAVFCLKKKKKYKYTIKYSQPQYFRPTYEPAATSHQHTA